MRSFFGKMLHSFVNIECIMWKTALSRLSSQFSRSSLNRAYVLLHQGQVLSVRFSEGLLRARVRDDSNIFNVYLDLKFWPKQSARCGCLEHNCEHVAAAILALDNKENQTLTQEKRETPLAKEKIIYARDVEWYSDIKDDNYDFFHYELGILIDEKPVNLVSLIVSLLERFNERTIDSISDNVEIKLSLDSGKVLLIQFGRIKPLLKVLLRYGLKPGSNLKNIKIEYYQLLLLQEAETAIAASKARWHATHDIKERLKKLVSVGDLPEIDLPRGLNAVLREYQYEGLKWLQSLRAHNFGGVLADDMGLGKTIQTLAHLQCEKEAGRLKRASLIVVPRSLIGNWVQEAKRFTKELKVLIFHGALRHDDDFSDYDLIISTYGLLQRDKTRFLKYNFYYLILDEAQSIKNARAKTTQIVQQVQASHRLCLTGTPVENHLGEMWSLFHFLMPGFLGEAKEFLNNFRVPIEKHNDLDKKQHLIEKIRPFILRRTKNEVAQELPSKTEVVQLIELRQKQRDLYEAIRISMEKKVRDAIAEQGLGKSHIVLLDALLKLRQVCCDPRLLTLPEAEMAYDESQKLDALMVLLDNLLKEGRFVLVFSQFTSMLKLIEEKLMYKKYNYLKLTGQTRDREKVVSEFQAGAAPIFLISLKAGGVGLNLTRADTVIHYDPWWNPQVEEQATDRTHRIGQINPVFVYKLIAKGTVEEVILEMQEKKRNLVDGILNANLTGNFKFNEEDLERFF